MTFTEVTYPDLDPPDRSWTGSTTRTATRPPIPEAFVDAVLEQADGHTVWLVWSPEYITLESQCGAVRNLLAEARPGNAPAVQADSEKFFENANLHRYPAP